MTTDITKRLQRELSAARASVGKYVRRPGCDYSRFGYNLDAAIADKRDFAVSWRTQVLEVAAGRPISEHSVRVISFGYGDDTCERLYRVFVVDGRDVLAVYAKGGSNCTGRIVEIADGTTAKDKFRKDGWRVIG